MNDFSYRGYISRQGIYNYSPYAQARQLASGQGSPIFTPIYFLRELFLQTVECLFPPDESALMSRVLLGDDGRIPAHLEQAFNDTGTAHIIAISG